MDTLLESSRYWSRKERGLGCAWCSKFLIREEITITSDRSTGSMESTHGSWIGSCAYSVPPVEGMQASIRGRAECRKACFQRDGPDPNEQFFFIVLLESKYYKKK